MLTFHGIRFRNGVPERFESTYELIESLKEALQILRQFDFDFKKSNQFILNKINLLYSPEERIKNSQKKLLFLTAKYSRVKDLIVFLFEEKETTTLISEIYKIILKPLDIKKSWKLIEDLLTNHFANEDSEEIRTKLCDEESSLSKIVQMSSLFFLEKTEESAPPNIQLKFTAKKFPKTVWINSNTLGNTANPLWIPKNPYCRVNYLHSCLLLAFKDKEIGKLKDIQVFQNINDSIERRIADQTYIEFRTDEEKQLSFIPKNLIDDFIKLQQEIQKKYSQEGVKIFLFLLKKFHQYKERKFDLNLNEILDSIGTTKKGPSDKKAEIIQGIIKDLNEFQIIRIWNNSNHQIRRKQPILKILSEEFVISNSKKTNDAQNKLPSYRVELDDLFHSRHEQTNIYFSSIRLIPEKVFSENIRIHSYLPGLITYFTGTWFHEFKMNKGVFQKSVEEIIDGCAFTLPKSGKYRVIQKLKSEITYLEKKKYIQKFSILKSSQNNPLKDIFQTIAPPEFLEEANRFFNTENQEINHTPLVS